MTYSSDLPRRSKFSLASQIMALLASAVVRATARNVCRALWYLTGCYPSYHPKGLTPAVLTRSIRALGAKYADVTVASIEWDLMECGGIGTVQRLHVTYAGDTGVDLPKSFVVKVLGDSMKDIIIGSTFELFGSELRTVSELRAVCEGLQPLIVAAPANRYLCQGLVVMEDLAYLRHKKSRSPGGISMDEANRMLAVCAELHKRSWGSTKYSRYRLGNNLTCNLYPLVLKGFERGICMPLIEARLPNVKRTLADTLALTDELEIFLKGCRVNGPYNPDDEATIRNLALVHGDMRLDNAFFDDKAKTCRMVDWQTVWFSNPVTDIIWMMTEFEIDTLTDAALEEYLQTYVDLIGDESRVSMASLKRDLPLGLVFGIRNLVFAAAIANGLKTPMPVADDSPDLASFEKEYPLAATLRRYFIRLDVLIGRIVTSETRKQMLGQ
eukprot:PhM_4_TR13935/c0_g2_i3/m.43581